MFGALTSLTGGGSMDLSSSSEATNGDNTFANDFNYKSSKGNGTSGGSNQQMLIMGAVAVALVLVVMRGK